MRTRFILSYSTEFHGRIIFSGSSRDLVRFSKEASRADSRASTKETSCERDTTIKKKKYDNTDRESCVFFGRFVREAVHEASEVFPKRRTLHIRFVKLLFRELLFGSAVASPFLRLSVFSALNGEWRVRRDSWKPSRFMEGISNRRRRRLYASRVGKGAVLHVAAARPKEPDAGSNRFFLSSLIERSVKSTQGARVPLAPIRDIGTSVSPLRAAWPSNHETRIRASAGIRTHPPSPFSHPKPSCPPCRSLSVDLPPLSCSSSSPRGTLATVQNCCFSSPFSSRSANAVGNNFSSFSAVRVRRIPRRIFAIKRKPRKQFGVRQPELPDISRKYPCRGSKNSRGRHKYFRSY